MHQFLSINCRTCLFPAVCHKRGLKFLQELTGLPPEPTMPGSSCFLAFLILEDFLAGVLSLCFFLWFWMASHLPSFLAAVSFCFFFAFSVTRFEISSSVMQAHLQGKGSSVRIFPDCLHTTQWSHKREQYSIHCGTRLSSLHMTLRDDRASAIPLPCLMLIKSRKMLIYAHAARHMQASTSPWVNISRCPLLSTGQKSFARWPVKAGPASSAISPGLAS